MAVFLGSVKNYEYYEKRTPGPGKKALLKDIYGSQYGKKTVTIIKPLPNLGNYWLVKFGKSNFAVHAKDIERIIVTRK